MLKCYTIYMIETNNLYEVTQNTIREVSPEVADLIDQELQDQRSYLKMIASENYCSTAVMAAQSSILTDVYSEGYPKHRYYAGCDNIDKLEELGQQYACELFGAEHAYLQPSTGSDCNLAAYWAILKAKVVDPMFKHIQEQYSPESCLVYGVKYDANAVPKTLSDLTKSQWETIRQECHNQKLLAMDYSCGGHLTHGYRQNISAQMFDVYQYGVIVDKEGSNYGLIDYDALEEQAMKIKPLILLAGYSAYPRKLNFKKFRDIANKCGAVLMIDMSHFAGLVAGKVYEGEYNPVPYADIVTTTTHKTFRGPRGAMILCKEWLAEYVDSSCPTCMGGQLPQILAAKVVALKEAMTEDYRNYAEQIIWNSKALAKTLRDNGIKVCTGGSDNHIVLIDASPLNLNGRQAENILRECHITVNRNALPNDPNGPWYTSGIRLGTAALTTLGMKEAQMENIGEYIATILKSSKPYTTKEGKISKTKVILNIETKENITNKVIELVKEYPAYKELG